MQVFHQYQAGLETDLEKRKFYLGILGCLHIIPCNCDLVFAKDEVGLRIVPTCFAMQVITTDDDYTSENGRVVKAGFRPAHKSHCFRMFIKLLWREKVDLAMMHVHVLNNLNNIQTKGWKCLVQLFLYCATNRNDVSARCNGHLCDVT